MAKVEIFVRKREVVSARALQKQTSGQFTTNSDADIPIKLNPYSDNRVQEKKEKTNSRLVAGLEEEEG